MLFLAKMEDLLVSVGEMLGATFAATERRKTLVLRGT